MNSNLLWIQIKLSLMCIFFIDFLEKEKVASENFIYLGW